MLPSLRHFFRFVDLDDTFVAHGFYKKVHLKTITSSMGGTADHFAYTDWCSIRIK